MNSVGNDNYRPDLVPPKPIRQNTGWLSSNMAQLMVFLNGLILTITAFATLNVFINEIIREELLETTAVIQDHVFNEYDKAQSDFNTLSVLLAQPETTNDEFIKNYIGQHIEESKTFNALYAIRNINSDLTDDNLIYKKDDYQVSFNQINQKIKSMDSNSFSSDDIGLFYLQGKETEDSMDVSSPVLLVKKKAEKNSLLLGIFYFENFIRQEWLEESNTLDSIRIFNTETGESIFSVGGQAQELNGFSQYSDMKSQAMGDKTIGVEISLSAGSREAFLQKIPLLMLLFGITLTLIGTLYVRNNQAQSKKLATMNKELAYKNFELNQQMNEREKLNQRMQKSAREHQSIINAVSDIIFELSEDGSITFLNEAWTNVTGFGNDRSIGRNFFDLIYVQDQAELRKNFDDLIRGREKSYRMFTRLRSADGKFRAVELSLSMVRQGQDKNLQLVGTITDVEERRRAERALSEAERKYRTIVENAASGIYQVTPEGQFLSANPAYARILGYGSAESVLRDVKDAINEIYKNPDDHKKFLKDIASLNMPNSHEAQIKRKDETVIWINENIRPVFDDEQNLLYYEGSIEDIDQRKQAEIAMKDAKVESDLANRSKSEFLANMSHELRTPLNAIIGFSDIIRTQAFGEIKQTEYTDYAGNIYESGNHLLRVINEILDVSRIDAGERTLHESVIDVKEAIASCLALMESKIKAANVKIDNKVDGGIGLIGEKQALKQMLINLFSNAIKFSPENSFVTIGAELDEKKRLRLSITDNGTGMSDAELEKALSPFGQIDTEHKRNKSGTGLGLTLVQSLIELHGGELEIVSQRGIGTTAILIFPEKRITKSREEGKKPGIEAEEVENT
ncbi:MAG: PAS domain-containing sensor histidine kinase [Pseudomonadota bacterium]